MLSVFLKKKLREKYRIPQKEIWMIIVTVSWIVFWNNNNYPIVNWIVARGMIAFFLGLILADVLKRFLANITISDCIGLLLLYVLCFVYILKMLISTDHQNFVYIFGVFTTLIILAAKMGTFFNNKTY